MKPTGNLFLPWHHDDSGLILGTPRDTESEDYPFIADTATVNGMEDDEDIERADFITLACNAHHDLMDAAKAVIAAWGSGDLAAAIKDMAAIIGEIEG